MSAANCSFVTCCEPATATSLSSRVALEDPPQPATSAREQTARKASRFMEKAPCAADSSRCPARGQYSIDQSKRLRKSLLAQADLVVRRGVYGGVDAPTQVAELAGSEHHLTDARLPAAEHEVVGADLRELELRLLDEEEV